MNIFVSQVTLGADGYGTSGPKSKKRKGSVERQKSRLGMAEIYVPSSDEWPVNLVSFTEIIVESKNKNIFIGH